MKKIIYLALFIAPVAIGQTTDYTLSQAVNVGCSSGIADLGKKITVEKTDASAKFTLTNMACSKSYDGSLKVDFGSGATGYFDGKEKKGIVIDGQEISLFNNDGSKYHVVIAGHQDKKLAKTIATEAQQAKYQKVFDGFDALLVSAKKEAAKAEMAAKILPIPVGNYEDKYGIGGLYYFSEPLEISSYTKEIDGKYAQAVQFQFDENDNYTLKAYINDKVYDKFFLDGSKMFKAFKEGKINNILFHKADHMNNIKAFKTELTKLEDGTYMVGGFQCSEALNGELKTHIKDSYIILGKDQNRVAFLAKNPREVEYLAMVSTQNQCKLHDALVAASKPMPEPSAMNTAKLKSEATELSKSFGKGRWAQEVQYAYIIGKDWYIIRNKLTGIITGRAIAAVVILKEKNGTYKWEEISIRQDYNGTEYGVSYFGGESTLLIPVEAGNAMKYK